jgi:hypothetical protein
MRQIVGEIQGISECDTANEDPDKQQDFDVNRDAIGEKLQHTRLQCRLYTYIKIRLIQSQVGKPFAMLPVLPIDVMGERD